MNAMIVSLHQLPASLTAGVGERKCEMSFIQIPDSRVYIYPIWAYLYPIKTTYIHYLQIFIHFLPSLSSSPDPLRDIMKSKLKTPWQRIMARPRIKVTTQLLTMKMFQYRESELPDGVNVAWSCIDWLDVCDCVCCATMMRTPSYLIIITTLSPHTSFANYILACTGYADLRSPPSLQ